MKDRGQALRLLEQINSNEISFGDAARRFSSCASSGKGGALGQFRPGQMSPAFDALVFDPATEIGEVYVCSTQFGTHLVKVLVRTGDPPASSTAEVAAEATAAPEAEAASSVDPLRAAAEAAAAQEEAAAALALAEAEAAVAAAEVAAAEAAANAAAKRLAASKRRLKE
jgi:peptidyl-prolyl cis-trans isomerase C